jgi:hypothetical protein
MKKTIEIFLKVFLVLISLGAWAIIAIFIEWRLGIEYKIALLWSLIIASTALAGFTSLILTKIARDGKNLGEKIGMSERRIKNCRIFLSWSVIIGCLMILAVMFYFITYETSLIIVAWVFFIIQLELFILPLIFSKIFTFR